MNRLTLTFVAVALCAVATTPLTAERYLVVFEQENLKAQTAQQIVDLHGAKMIHNHADLGVAVVDAPDQGFASKAATDRKILGVYRDVLMDTAPGPEPIPATLPTALRTEVAFAKGDEISFGELAVAPQPLTPSTVTVDDLTSTFFWPMQWDLHKLEMERVWTELGNLGDEDVDIAIVASGIDYTHVELEGRVDLDRSRNFVPEDAAMVQDLYPGAHPIADLGFHGTYTASVMVCNARVHSCPVPHATLIGVKWLNNEERGRIGDLVTAVRYAASIGSDVIVIPDQFERKLRWSVREDRHAIIALKRAMLYAWLRGSMVITGAWGPLNQCGFDADADGDALIAPAQMGTTVVAATGLQDQWSAISSYGRSLVDISAPGGEFEQDTCQADPNLYVFSVGACSSFTRWVAPFGTDFSTICNFETAPVWTFSLGVRPAAAHVGSVATLVESVWNGWLPGWLVNRQVLRTSDDVLTPGFDAYSGRGRVNAYRALTE